MLAWTAAIVLEKPPCHEMHLMQGHEPVNMECSFMEFLQNWFWSNLRDVSAKELFVAPTRWLCLPYVRKQLDASLMQSVLLQPENALSVFAGKRLLVRPNKRTIRLVQQKLEQQLPVTSDAILELESQGYLCVHCTFATHQITYWYENPDTNWVACVGFDPTTGLRTFTRIEVGNPEFYQLFLKEGVSK